jgi:hypothetical protein
VHEALGGPRALAPPKDAPSSVSRADGMSYHRAMGYMSNRDRIARAAEEAEIAAKEKAAKKSAKKRPDPAARMKVIWEVCDGTGKVIEAFPYPDKAQAEAEVEARTRSTGRSHILRPTKVPMDE